MFFKKIIFITALVSGFCSVNIYAKTDVSAVIKQQIDSNNTQKQVENQSTGIKTESETISVVEEMIANKNQNNILETAKAENIPVTEPVKVEEVAEPKEEEKEEKEEKEEIKEEIKEEVVANNGGLTPEGNFTLVDDISETKIDGDIEKSTDFMTVVTKNGNYLYLVIDKKNGSENVHLLNMVDESDLMSLITGEPVTYEIPTKQEEIIETPPPIVEEVLEEEIPVTTKTVNLNFLIILIILGGLGFYAYKNWFQKDEVDDYEEYNEDLKTEDFYFTDENFEKMLDEDEV